MPYQLMYGTPFSSAGVGTGLFDAAKNETNFARNLERSKVAMQQRALDLEEAQMILQNRRAERAEALQKKQLKLQAEQWRQEHALKARQQAVAENSGMFNQTMAAANLALGTRSADLAERTGAATMENNAARTKIDTARLQLDATDLTRRTQLDAARIGIDQDKNAIARDQNAIELQKIQATAAKGDTTGATKQWTAYTNDMQVNLREKLNNIQKELDRAAARGRELSSERATVAAQVEQAKGPVKARKQARLDEIDSQMAETSRKEAEKVRLEHALQYWTDIGLTPPGGESSIPAWALPTYAGKFEPGMAARAAAEQRSAASTQRVDPGVEARWTALYRKASSAGETYRAKKANTENRLILEEVLKDLQSPSLPTRTRAMLALEHLEKFIR